MIFIVAGKDSATDEVTFPSYQTLISDFPINF
jgi:hypothetical protein